MIRGRAWLGAACLLAAVWAGGCPAADDVPEADTSETGAATSGQGATVSTSGALDAGETTSGTSTGPSDPSATDTGEELPAECAGIATDETPRFERELVGKWPDGASAAADDLECTVVTVDTRTNPQWWITELACDYEAEVRTLLLRTVARESLSPSWAPGEDIRLLANIDYGLFGGRDTLAMYDAVGGLLLHGVRGFQSQSPPPPPLSVTLDYDYCDAPQSSIVEGPLRPLRVAFDVPGAMDPVALMPSESGVLDGSDGTQLRVDLYSASSGHCCHGFVFLSWLAQRI